MVEYIRDFSALWANYAQKVQVWRKFVVLLKYCLGVAFCPAVACSAKVIAAALPLPRCLSAEESYCKEKTVIFDGNIKTKEKKGAPSKKVHRRKFE